MFSASNAAAGNIDDTVYLTSGGRVRGLIVEENPTAGVRLKLPDGSIRTIAPKDVDHVKYGGQAPAPAAPVVGIARLRLRATCAKSTKVLDVHNELVVEEIGDGPDRALKPAGADPEFVDYELPAGSHRLRIRAKRCNPHEEQTALEAGATVELSPHLDETPAPLVPIAFLRPSFVDSSETMAVLDTDGKVVCANLPCTANVPAFDQRYYLKWTKSSGKIVTLSIPNPGEDTDKKTFEARVNRVRTISAAGPATMGAGAFVAFIGLLAIANNSGANAVDPSGRQAVGAGIAIGGGVIILGGAVMMLAGVGRGEKLSIMLSGREKEVGSVSLRVLPSGLGVAF